MSASLGNPLARVVAFLAASVTIIGCAAADPHPLSPLPLPAAPPPVDRPALSEIEPTGGAPHEAQRPEGEATKSASAPPPIAREKLAALSTRLEAILSSPILKGAQVGALVIDAASGAVVFERGADRALVPASNEKLITTAAALALLGPDHRAITRAWADAEPDARGEVDTLTLDGAHDLTWQKAFHDDPGQPLDRLAEALKAAGVRRVRGRVVIGGEPLLELERFGELDVRKHRARVAARFRSALAGAGIVAARVETSDGPVSLPQGAKALAEWRSEPLSRSVAIINQLSHNEMADALIRHVGRETRGDPSAGPAAALGWLSGAGVPSQGVAIADGSGLSRGNHATPRALVALLSLARLAPWGEAFTSSLAVAGQSGTLARRMRSPDTEGRVLGKTGTLAEVVSLSGYARNRHDGRTYVFSLLFNGVRDGNAARKAEDRLLAELAGPWSGEAPRLASSEAR